LGLHRSGVFGSRQKLARDYRRFFQIKAYLWEHEPMLASGHFQDAIEPPSASDVVLLIVYDDVVSAACNHALEFAQFVIAGKARPQHVRECCGASGSVAATRSPTRGGGAVRRGVGDAVHRRRARAAREPPVAACRERSSNRIARIRNGKAGARGCRDQTRALAKEERAAEALRATQRETAQTLAAQVQLAHSQHDARCARTLAVQAGNIEKGGPARRRPSCERAHQQSALKTHRSSTKELSQMD